jgi:pimeloyl-ACP methyl ester carboxylesterase
MARSGFGSSSCPDWEEMEKPLVLLIPGLDGTGQLYFKQLRPLSSRYRVLAWSFRSRAVFDFEDLVQELGAGTEGEAPGSILVVGESFGGIVAMHYVLAFPERIRRLILVNAFPYYRRRVRIRLGRALAPLLEWKTSRRIKSVIVDRILRSEGIEEPDIENYRRVVRQVQLEAYYRRLLLVQQADLRARLHEIRVPTVILASGRDKLVPSKREASYMASKMPHATLHEFPRAGHALLLTPGFTLADYADECKMNARVSSPDEQ